MRFTICTACAVAVLVLVGCGTDKSADTTEARINTTEEAAGVSKGSTVGSFEQEGPFAAISGGKVDVEPPHIDPPDRPPPEKLLKRELEAGSGPAARSGDEVDIFYAGAVYKTGEYRYGGSTQPFPLGSGGLGGAFEEGIEGMKAGGRRELIVPSRLLDGTPAIDYVIVLVSLKPAPAKP